MAPNPKKQAAHQLGELGEQAVEAWYRAAGYTILARNWRCFEGEIDIIAERADTIAICEVKARSSDHFIDPALSVGPTKQIKVRTAAFRWLSEVPRPGRLRFDVALVIAGRIEMIEGAF